MNYRLFIAIFLIGFFVGLAAITTPSVKETLTGSVAAEPCYANNELCDCNNTTCLCGDLEVPLEHCLRR